MSSSTSDSSSSPKSDSESPPSKRALIPSPSVESIARQQHCFKSKTEQFRFNHKWIIENYCLDENNSDEYPSICSSIFSLPFNSKLRFRLELYPNGFDEEDKGNVSLFLRLCDCDKDQIDLKYKFRIWNSDEKAVEGFDSKSNFSKDSSWGTGNFLSHEDIPRFSSSELIPGNVISILCRIYHQVTVTDDPLCHKIALTELQIDCYQLKFSDEFCDVVLVFGEGENKKEYRAHKAILGARSEVFAAMFDHDMREKNNNRVEMTDVNAEVGQEILNYLYSDNNRFYLYAEELLPFADKYQLHSLKSICEGFLCFRINPESVGNLLLLADMHNAALLKSKCIEYIHCHSICVVECESMKGLMLTRPELYYEVFKHIPSESLPLNFVPPTLTADLFMLSWTHTDSKVIKCSQIWTINRCNYDYLSVAEDEHVSITSPVFSFSNSNKNFLPKFRVKLYPHGENADCKDHLSLYLHLKCDKKMQIAVEVRVSIVVNKNSAKGYTLETGKKMSNGDSIGWSKFIAQKELMDQNKLLLNGTDDQLVLLCEVYYIENIDEPVTNSGVNTFAEEHEFSFAHDLSKFYEKQKLTDAVFVIDDKEFNVHKSIVSARSEVFAQMFVDTNRVQIDGVDDVDAFEQMLALVYGQTEGLTQWAHKMLPLLDKFKLNSLKKVCQLVLCDQIDDKNVAHFVMLADKHSAGLLKAKAFEYIRSKHSVLTKNDALKVIQEKNSKLFYEVLCYKLENWKNTNLVDK